MEPLWTREAEMALEAQANALLDGAPPSPEYPFVRKLKTWRRRKREVPFCEAIAMDLGDEQARDEEASTDEIVKQCTAAMKKAGLTPEERACVYLTRFQGLTQEDVARIFGYEDRTVRNRLESAFRKLAALRGS